MRKAPLDRCLVVEEEEARQRVTFNHVEFDHAVFPAPAAAEQFHAHAHACRHVDLLNTRTASRLA